MKITKLIEEHKLVSKNYTIYLNIDFIDNTVTPREKNGRIIEIGEASNIKGYDDDVAKLRQFGTDQLKAKDE